MKRAGNKSQDEFLSNIIRTFSFPLLYTKYKHHVPTAVYPSGTPGGGGGRRVLNASEPKKEAYSSLKALSVSFRVGIGFNVAVSFGLINLDSKSEFRR